MADDGRTMDRLDRLSRRSAAPSTPRMIVGDFERLEEIGKGSFAYVYRGRHMTKGGLVAIKSVNIDKLTKKLQDNLEAEVRILHELHHPHIVGLFDAPRTTGRVHLCMEFCELGDLSSFIKKRSSLVDHEVTRDMIKKYPLPPSGGLHEVIVRHFLQQIASALSFLRKKSLLHRDIKPQNLLLLPPRQWYQIHGTDREPVMMDETWTIPPTGVPSLPSLKVADFGFARFLPSIELAETLCGSPLYMAPEILRYEKYDAKADLWSVGTVLFEMMVGRPPFRAINHVELLRKIERNDDRIRFPDNLTISRGMKNIIRALLKRTPTERISYENFFADPAVVEQIPGLVGEDKPREVYTQNLANRISKTRLADDASTSPQSRGIDLEAEASPRSRIAEGKMPARRDSLRRRPSQAVNEKGDSSKTPLLLQEAQSPVSDPARRVERRPSIRTTATAPVGEKPTQTEIGRRSSRMPIAPSSSMLKEHLDRERGKTEERASREQREKTAQEIAFEREYVVVEKRHVEVNAFADELAHSPQVGARDGAMARRATTSGVPLSTTAPSSTSRAMQIATRQSPLHGRQGSFERRFGRSPQSATSAISKALNMANFRLFGMGFSPPSGKGPSPPNYSPFPTYPMNQSSMLMIGDGGRHIELRDDDFRIAQQIEDLAHRSDVIWGFADIKYQQLVPSRPVSSHGFGLGGIKKALQKPDRQPIEEPDLPVEHIVLLSEEALVLFVKVLAVLKKIMDVSASWFHNARVVMPSSDVPRSAPTRTGMMAAAPRINSVVQWARTRFNDALEKSDFVARKLTEAQKRLPLDHPHHPNNLGTSSTYSGTSIGTSADAVMLTSGVTAEKLMYDRALEMSRGAAVSEAINDELDHVLVAYRTAIYMLEAVLDTDEVKMDRNEKAKKDDQDEDGLVNGMEDEDRASIQKVIDSLKIRLRTTRKKIEVQREAQKAAERNAKRNSLSAIPPGILRNSPSTTPQLSRSPAL